MRNDIDQIVARVEAEGVCVVPDFISGDILERIRTRIDQLNESERRDGVAFLESEGVNQRVFNLVNKGEVFEEIVQHEDVMAAAGKLLGGDFILSGFSSNTAGPGGEEMVLHSDSGYVPPPHPEYLLACNAIWMLDDFTAENGGTQYVPGSHKLRTNPDPRGEYRTVPILGKAGIGRVPARIHLAQDRRQRLARSAPARAVRILRAAVPARAGKPSGLRTRGSVASRHAAAAASARRRSVDELDRVFRRPARTDAQNGVCAPRPHRARQRQVDPVYKS